MPLIFVSLVFALLSGMETYFAVDPSGAHVVTSSAANAAAAVLLGLGAIMLVIASAVQHLVSKLPGS